MPAAPADGSPHTVTITATVPAGTANGTVLRNEVTVNGDQPDPTRTASNRDDTQTRVVIDDPVPPLPPAPPDPDGPPEPPAEPSGEGDLLPAVLGTRLSLSKRASVKTFTPGTRIIYRLRVANTGEAQPTRPRLRHPAGRPDPDRGARLPPRVRRRVPEPGELPIGASRVVRIIARATAAAPATVTNIATARAANARRVSARATVRAFAPCAVAAAARGPSRGRHAEPRGEQYEPSVGEPSNGVDGVAERPASHA